MSAVPTFPTLHVYHQVSLTVHKSVVAKNRQHVIFPHPRAVSEEQGKAEKLKNAVNIEMC